MITGAFTDNPKSYQLKALQSYQKILNYRLSKPKQASYCEDKYSPDRMKQKT